VEGTAFLVAAAVQAALVVALALRARHREWLGVLAALFALNAAVCAYRGFLLFQGGPLAPWLNDLMHFGLEPATSYVLAYLFLLLPDRPRWARGRPWALRSAVFLPLLVQLALTAALPGLTNQFHSTDPLAASIHLLFLDLAPAACWCIVLLRGAWALAGPASPVWQQRTAILYAAVGLRAAHASILQFLLRISANTAPLPYGVGVAVSAFPVLALLAAFAILARRRGAGGAAGRHATLALGSLSLGCVLAFPFAEGTFNPDTGWPQFITHYDLYVVRPAMVWALLLRAVPGAPAARPGAVALPLLTLFVAAGALAATATGFQSAFGTPVLLAAFSLAVAAAVSVAAWPLGKRILGTAPADRPARPRGGTDVEAYLDALEDTLRSPGDGARPTLAALRRRFGVSAGQERALRRAIERNWKEPARQEWEPTDLVLARYEVQGLLGEGGAGKAYLARDILADEPVVLKRTGSLDARARQSLLLESAALRRLDSPRIVRQLRTERWEGEPVLVLEHVAGGSLADRLRDGGPLPLEEALAVADDILEGLAAAHAEGLVHGDLKPSNVLLGGDGRAKLSDFGACTAPEAAGLLDQTAAAPATGTLRYMAPEQARGLPTDARSDLYSLAMTLLTCLAGTHPHEAPGSKAADPRTLVPASLPPAVRRILRSCLAADPELRPASAAEVQAGLRRAAGRLATAGTAGGSARPPPRPRAPAPARRRAAARPS
jgi:hypothetical protein